MSADTLIQTASRRQAEDLIVASIRQGNCCRALGPRRCGKTELIRNVGERLRQNGHFVVSYESLLNIPDNEALVFSRLYEQLCASLNAEPAIRKLSLWKPSRFQDETQRLLSEHRQRVVMLIDGLEMAMPNLVASLLQTLRAIYMQTVSQKNFMVVACGTFISRRLLSDMRYSSFEAISDRVLIGDYDEAERLSYARLLCDQHSLIPSDPALALLFKQVGGDGFLIKTILKSCAERLSAPDDRHISANLIQSVIDSLTQHPNKDMMEALALLEESEEWIDTTLDILNKGKLARREMRVLGAEFPNQLDLSGAFCQSEDTTYRVKSPMWERILRHRFKSYHVGSLYAAEGKWMRGINCLGKALHEQDEQARAQLITTALNAIFTSDSVDTAFEYVGQTLRHLYPNCEIRVYRSLEDNTLHLSYTNLLNVRRRTIEKTNAPEIAALIGTEYTYDDRRHRILIPMRTHQGRQRHIGLAAIRLNADKLSYDQRAEMPAVIKFLNQASSRIALLDAETTAQRLTEQRARRLRTINAILSKILADAALNEMQIYRLMLAGVTAHLGLEFNRALLFLMDESKPELIVRLAVGDIDEKDARKKWKSIHEDLGDDPELLIQATLQPQPPSPLESALAGIAIDLDSERNLVASAFHERVSRRIIEHSPDASLGTLIILALEPPEEYALIPISGLGARPFGVLYVDDKFVNRSIDDERFELLRAFVSQIALILETRNEAQRQAQRRNTITRLIPRIGKTLDEDALFEIVLSEIKALIPRANQACVVLRDTARKALFIPSVCRKFYQIDDASKWQDGGFYADTSARPGIAGIAIARCETINTGDVETHLTDYIPAIAATVSQLCVPISENDAALVLESETRDAFSDDDAALVQALADQLAVALQSARQFRELETIKRGEAERQTLQHMAELASGLTHDIQRVSAGAPDRLDDIKAILAERGWHDERIDEKLQLTKDQFQQVDEISERLRDYVVVKRLTPGYHALREVVENTVRVEQERAPERVRLQIASSPDVTVFIDVNWIKLVLQNLISNAFNAIPGDRQGVIEIRWRRNRNYVHVRVADNGIGIARENLDKVFEPGFSTRRDERRMHGIGLYHCKLVIQEHHGSIAIRSKVGRGTVIRFTLPLKPWEDFKP
jgi:signal transduction histidine kinase